MRRWFALLAGIELLLALCACGGAQTPASGSSQGAPASADFVSEPENRSVGLCIGLTRYPLHQIVQLGFLEKAEELGYEGHVLGLEEGLMQEQCACWLQGAKEYDIAGAVCWVGDDSGYEFLKELHGMGVKIAVFSPCLFADKGVYRCQRPSGL